MTAELTSSLRVAPHELHPIPLFTDFPPKFVLHGLSSKSKFLAVSGLNHHVHLHRYPLLR